MKKNNAFMDMKKIIILFLVTCLLCQGLMAQSVTQKAATFLPKGRKNALALGLCFPVGAFKRTHTAGIAIDYFLSNRRYGNDILTNTKIGFVGNAGINYYVGKSVPTNGYAFRYGGYFTAYVMGGIDYKPAMPVNISLTVGPVVSIYQGSADINIGAALVWNYYINSRVAIGPGVTFRKQIDSEALWSATIGASYAF